LSYKKVKAKAF